MISDDDYMIYIMWFEWEEREWFEIFFNNFFKVLHCENYLISKKYNINLCFFMIFLKILNSNLIFIKICLKMNSSFASISGKWEF